jgi:protein TonB
MFDQTFVDTKAHTRKPWTVAASLTFQTTLIAAALLVPLLHPGTIEPKFNIEPALFLTRLTPPPPVELKRMPEQRISRPSRIFINPLQGPIRVPRTIDMTPDPAPEIAVPGPAAPSGASLAVLIPEPPPQPKPALNPKPAATAAPMQVSEGVQAARLIFAPRPQYPALARTARVQGTVRIRALVARNGVIENLQVLSGPPLLVTAAMQAVQQWRYQPTLLSGEPVEVITEIAVNFTLN